MLSRSPFVSRPIQAALVAVLLLPLVPQAASAQPAHDHVSRNFDACTVRIAPPSRQTVS